jgi:hypothetical protein
MLGEDNTRVNLKLLMFVGGLIAFIKRKSLINKVKYTTIAKSILNKFDFNKNLVDKFNSVLITEKNISKKALNMNQVDITEKAYIFNYDSVTSYGVKVFCDESGGGNSVGEIIFNSKNSSLILKGKFKMVERDLIENRIMYSGLTFSYQSNVRFIFIEK